MKLNPSLGMAGCTQTATGETLTETLQQTEKMLDAIYALFNKLEQKLNGPQPSGENCKEALKGEIGICDLARFNSRKAERICGDLANLIDRL